MLSKRCPRCDVAKSLDEFGTHRGQPLGKAIWCRQCARESDRQRRSDAGVLAAGAASARERRKRPEVRERIALYDAQYRAANRDKIRERYLSDEGRKRAREFRRTERGREINRQAQARRRARLAAVEATLTEAEWIEIQAAFHLCCAYCLRERPLQMDHLEPLARGGSHTKENVVPACRQCNQSKGCKGLLRALAHGVGA